MQETLVTASELKFHVDIAGTDRAKRMTADFSTRRPNQFRVAATMPGGRYNLVSDGKVLTVERPSSRTFAQYPAGKDLLGTMYTAAGLMNITGRMLDFFWTADTRRSGKDVIVSSLPPITVNGNRCDGMKVVRYEEIHQIWISQSDPPLPCRLITQRADGSAQETQTHVFRWTQAPVLEDKTFRFEPASSSRKVDALDLR